MHSRALTLTAALALGAVVPTTAAADPAVSPRLVVKLERLGCFGRCPIYKLAIFSDGQVLYRGQQFVAVRGRRRAMLGSAELAEVVRAFTDAGFADLPRELWCDMTDTATSRLTFVDGTRRTKVYRAACGDDGPPDLVAFRAAVEALEDLVDRIAGTERWVERSP